MKTIGSDWVPLQLVGSMRGPLASVTDRLRQLAGAVESGYQRQRQRRALGSLDRRLLRDVGISPAQARCESGKPFWRG